MASLDWTPLEELPRLLPQLTETQIALRLLRLALAADCECRSLRTVHYRYCRFRPLHLDLFNAASRPYRATDGWPLFGAYQPEPPFERYAKMAQPEAEKLLRERLSLLSEHQFTKLLRSEVAYTGLDFGVVHLSGKAMLVGVEAFEQEEEVGLRRLDFAIFETASVDMRNGEITIPRLSSTYHFSVLKDASIRSHQVPLLTKNFKESIRRPTGRPVQYGKQHAIASKVLDDNMDEILAGTKADAKRRIVAAIQAEGLKAPEKTWLEKRVKSFFDQFDCGDPS